MKNLKIKHKNIKINLIESNKLIYTLKLKNSSFKKQKTKNKKQKTKNKKQKTKNKI
jgi:hypothetical protein